MWNENISCYTNKQDMSQPSAISGLQMWMRAPQTVIQKMLLLPHPHRTPHPRGDWWLLSCWGGGMQEAAICYFSKWTRKQYLAADNWGAYERNEFSEPRGLHLSIQRMLNSLTWQLISDVQTAFSLCCKLVYSLTSPPASLEQFSQSYWDTVSWAPKHSHQIK